MRRPAFLGEADPVPRGLTKQQASAYVGCATLAAFDRWRVLGIIPPAIPGTNRWDKKALDLSLDKASGLLSHAATGNEASSPYKRWRSERETKA